MQLGATSGARPMGAFSTGVRINWGLSQRLVHVDCGLSYTTVQAIKGDAVVTVQHRLVLLQNADRFQYTSLK